MLLRIFKSSHANYLYDQHDNVCLRRLWQKVSNAVLAEKFQEGQFSCGMNEFTNFFSDFEYGDN